MRSCSTGTAFHSLHLLVSFPLYLIYIDPVYAIKFLVCGEKSRRELLHTLKLYHILCLHLQKPYWKKVLQFVTVSSGPSANPASPTQSRGRWLRSHAPCSYSVELSEPTPSLSTLPANILSSFLRTFNKPISERGKEMARDGKASEIKGKQRSCKTCSTFSSEHSLLS